MRPLLTLCVALATALAAAAQTVTVVDFPADRQLVPRRGIAPSATLTLRGTVTPAATAGGRLTAKLATAAGADVDQATVALADLPAGQASDFALALEVPVARVDHRVTLTLERADGTSEVLAQADRVVAGEAWVINGQSNAEARGRIAREDRDEFLRGYNDPTGDVDPSNTGWVELRYARGGNWVGRTAKRLSRELDLPIAVFVYAQAAQELSYFEVDSPDSNYVRALRDLRRADVADGVSVFLWAQGEADGFETTTRDYRARFDALMGAYRRDLGVDRVYAFQTRPYSCGATGPRVAEAQRRLARDADYLELLATTNVRQHPDGCHFAYEGGYAVIGERVADWLSELRYGLPLTGTRSPDVDSARVTGPREITAYLRVPGSTLAVSGAPWPDFVAEGIDAAATGGTVVGNAVVLAFGRDVADATGLSYRGRTDTTLDYLRNARGVGALLWHDVSLVPGDGAAGRPADVRLAFDRIDGEGPLAAGGEARLELTVANTGGTTLTDLVTAVALPAGLRYPPRAGDVYRGRSRTAGAFRGDTGEWEILRLRPGASATLTLEVEASPEAVTSGVVWAQVLAHDQRDADSEPGDGIAGAVMADDEARVVIGEESGGCALDVELTESACAAATPTQWRLGFTVADGPPDALAYDVSVPGATVSSTPTGELVLDVDSVRASGSTSLRVRVSRPAGELPCANVFALALPTGCAGTDPPRTCDTVFVADSVECGVWYELEVCDPGGEVDTIGVIALPLDSLVCSPADTGSSSVSPELSASAQSIGLSPNPVTAGATLSVVLSEGIGGRAPELLLYDPTGRAVYAQPLPRSADAIAFALPAGLPPGLYTLRIGSAVGRLVIK